MGGRSLLIAGLAIAGTMLAIAPATAQPIDKGLPGPGLAWRASCARLGRESVLMAARVPHGGVLLRCAGGG